MDELKVIKYKNQDLTKKYIEKLSVEDREEIAEYLFRYFRERGFPYPEFSEKELRKDWDDLLMADSSKVFSDKILFNHFNYGMHLFKHFSHNFYNIKKKRGKSFISAFNNDDLLRKCLRNRLGITHNEFFNITPAMLKQGLRNSYCCSAGSIFNPTLAKYIYDTYTEQDGYVYDYSVGFGQRALGALSSSKNLTYIGCDPEKNCIDNLVTLSKFLNRNDKIYVENSGSENFCPKELEGKICLAFSSPPYYDQEIYSDDDSQAYAKGFDYFINGYWKNTVNNINKLLKENGIFILNTTESLFINMKSNILLAGFELEDTLHIQLSKNQKFKNNEEKFEPVYIFRKK